MLSPDLLSTLAPFTAQGCKIEFSESRLTIIPASASETFEAPKAAPVASESSETPNASKVPNAIEVRTVKGHVLRSYDLSKLSKNELRVVRMMQVCASEGMHLWEMQHALYCAEHFKAPTLPPDISTVSLYMTYDPMRGWKSSFFRAALIEYVKARGSRLISRLKAI